MKTKIVVALGAFLIGGAWIGWIGCESAGESVSDNEDDDGSDSDSDSDSDGDADGDGDNDDDGFEDDDDGDDDDDDSDSEPICEEEVIDIVHKLSRLMILQDISRSMIQEDGTPVEKWNQAKAAITSLAQTFEAEVDMGLDFFPDAAGQQNNCSVDSPVISDSLPLNAQSIIDSLNAATPEGRTPLYDAMNNFTEASYAPEFTSDQADSYLCVVSDGRDTCGIDGNQQNDITPADLAAVTTTLLNDHDVSTFVIGFGDGVDPAQLNAIAENGGTDFTQYLVADDQASLEEAFSAIISSIVSCVYELEISEPNVDPEKVNFYFITLDDDDNEVKNLIPFDPDCAAGKGWQWIDFDNFIVEFCEEACEMLQTGEVIKIIAEFGCDVVVV